LKGDPKDLQPEKCVKIFYDTILDLVNENGRLSYEFEIGRGKLNGFLLEEPRKSIYKILVWGGAPESRYYQFPPIQSRSS